MTLTLKAPAPINNGRDTKGSHDRLIINDCGESVRAMEGTPRGQVRIQATQISYTDGKPLTAEVVLAKREAIAFILQIATMIGVACEVTE